MVILSVDYGDARTGIAVCDKLELLASPAAGIWMEAKASARKNAVRLPCNWKKHAVFPLGFGMND